MPGTCGSASAPSTWRPATLPISTPPPIASAPSMSLPAGRCLPALPRVSNTPLQWVLDSEPRQDTLAFQVDLWSARGALPHDLTAVEVRHKEIAYSSRTRAATNQYRNTQKLRIAVANLLKRIPEELRSSEDAKLLEREADEKVCNIVHLIYRARSYEGIAKDFEFSRRTMEEHWKSGYDNALRTLAEPEVMQLPDRIEGVRTF